MVLGPTLQKKNISHLEDSLLMIILNELNFLDLLSARLVEKRWFNVVDELFKIKIKKLNEDKNEQEITKFTKDHKYIFDNILQNRNIYNKLTEAEKMKRFCINCKKKFRNVYSMVCGHILYCIDCATNELNHLCICGQKMKSKIIQFELLTMQIVSSTLNENKRIQTTNEILSRVSPYQLDDPNVSSIKLFKILNEKFTNNNNSKNRRGTLRKSEVIKKIKNLKKKKKEDEDNLIVEDIIDGENQPSEFLFFSPPGLSSPRKNSHDLKTEDDDIKVTTNILFKKMMKKKHTSTDGNINTTPITKKSTIKDNDPLEPTNTKNNGTHQSKNLYNHLISDKKELKINFPKIENLNLLLLNDGNKNQSSNSDSGRIGTVGITTERSTAMYGMLDTNLEIENDLDLDPVTGSPTLEKKHPPNTSNETKDKPVSFLNEPNVKTDNEPNLRSSNGNVVIGKKVDESGKVILITKTPLKRPMRPPPSIGISPEKGIAKKVFIKKEVLGTSPPGEMKLRKVAKSKTLNAPVKLVKKIVVQDSNEN